MLVQRYESRVRAICMSYLRNPAEAQDVSQDVFIKVYTHLDGFRDESSFSAWLRTVTARACIDQKRRMSYRQGAEVDEFMSFDNLSEEPSDTMSTFGRVSPLQATERASLGRALQAALEAIPERLRDVILLCDVDGLSVEEAAELLGVPKGTVLSRRFNARAALKKHLLDRVVEEIGELTPEGEGPRRGRPRKVIDSDGFTAPKGEA